MLASSAEAIACANIEGGLQDGIGQDKQVGLELSKRLYLLLQVPLDDVREGVVTFLAWLQD